MIKEIMYVPLVVTVRGTGGHGHFLVGVLCRSQVYAWGNGSNGRLGLGDTKDRATACVVGGLEGHDVCAIFSGASHSMAVRQPTQCWAQGGVALCLSVGE
jgi:alpha-tubulin suppressor-like RCC1 family protein